MFLPLGWIERTFWKVLLDIRFLVPFCGPSMGQYKVSLCSVFHLVKTISRKSALAMLPIRSSSFKATCNCLLGCILWHTGHLNKDYCIMGCFSTVNGKWVISGSEDNQLYVWDLNTCQVAGKLTGHTQPVLCCDAHPSDRVIVSGSLDKTVKIWKWSLDV